MERFSQRESVLLAYSPRGSLTNSTSSPRTPCRTTSEFDFQDVFGGPPRRLSMQEKRCSFSEATEFYGQRGGNDEALSCMRVGEKPIFGEENVNRRRYPSDDFFDDIFRGDESLSSTPRKRDKEPFASAPGSRVLSPARPLPPKSEPFGFSSMSPQFSLPAKLAKEMDLEAFGSTIRSPSKCKEVASRGITFSSSSSSSSTLSRFSSQSIQSQEELGNDVQASYRQRPLSREVFLSSEGQSNLVKSDKLDTQDIMKKEPSTSDVSSDNSQFHFSIYKWASKGVPLEVPIRGGTSSRMNAAVKFERCSSWNMWLASEKATVSPTKSFKMECNKQENDSFLDTNVRDRVEPISSLQSVVEYVPVNSILHDIKKETKPQSMSLIDFCDIAEKEITVLTEEVHKPTLKTPCSLFFDNDYEQGTGSNGITEKREDKESTVKSSKNSSSVVDVSKNVKKPDGKRNTLNDVEADKASFPDSPINPGENLGRNRIKGKVKEFVKIFSQEASPKPKNDIGSQSQSSKWKKRGTYRAGNETNVNAAGLDETILRAQVNNTIQEASIKTKEDVKQSKKDHSTIKTTNHIFDDISSGQKDNLSSSTASISNGSKATVEDTDESFHGNFPIKKLTQVANGLPQSGDNQEEIQGIDAKIRQWSNGKKGNIRSLLSTLQYVLWPGSGWKPVPLVDIIEGNSVKRAYQKALLSLHPDKLQQKGAASHQKYIAEKVFETLQEAWNHFNSLGSL